MKRALIVGNTLGLITDFLENDFTLLRKKGYKIDVCCNTLYKGKNSDFFLKKYVDSVYSIDFPIREIDLVKITKSFFKFKKVVKMNEYSFIHCHSTIVSIICRQCIKRRQKNGLKVAYTSHGLSIYEGNSKLKNFLFNCIENYYSKYTNAIITICSEDYENVKKMKCKNVFLIPGVGVELKEFHSILFNDDIKSIKKNLKIENYKIVFISVGELNDNKNHEVAIRALGDLKIDNYVYLICGKELTQKGKMQYLKGVADNLKVNVKFLGFRKDVNKILSVSDIGIFPSLKEGLGLSGIEMLATGIPMVASNRQGIKDYVKDGVNGYLCDPTSIESFENGILNTIQLLKRKDIKKICYNSVKKYDKAKAYEKMENIYKSIL